MAGVSPMLFGAGPALANDESYFDGASVGVVGADQLRYQSQYFGLVGDLIRFASYEVADFHESTSA